MKSLRTTVDLTRTYLLLSLLVFIVLMPATAPAETYSVVSIDLNPGEVLGISPGLLTANEASGSAYVLNANGVLSLVESSPPSILESIGIGSGDYSAIGQLSAYSKIYIADQTRDAVLQVADSGSLVLDDIIAVGSNPRDIAVDVSAKKIYVSNYGTVQNPGNNTVTVLNYDSISGVTSVEATITVGKNPMGIGINESTKYAYVANEGSGNVTVIDIDPNRSATYNTVVSTITLFGPAGAWGPARVAVDETRNRIYVLSRGNVGAPGEASVAAIDGATNSLIKNVAIPGVYFSDVLRLRESENVIIVNNLMDSLGSGLHTLTALDGVAMGDPGNPINIIPTVIPATDIGTPIDDFMVQEATERAYLYTEDGVFIMDVAAPSPTFSIIGSPFALPGNGEAGGLAVDEPNNVVYAAAADANAVGIISYSAGETRSTVSVGGGPKHIRVDSSRNLAWVAQFGTGTGVRKIEGSTKSFTNINLGGWVQVVSMAETADWIYAHQVIVDGVNATYELVPIDVISGAPAAAIPLNSSGGHWGFNETTRRLYLVERPNNLVKVFDIDTNAEVASFSVGMDPEGVAVNEADDLVYVANNTSGAGPGTVSAIDGVINAVITEIPTANAADQIAINQSTKRAYVTYDGEPVNGVKVIDVNPANAGTTFNTVIETINVGTDPEYIAVNEATDRIYVVDEDENSPAIVVINGSSNTLEAVIPLPAPLITTPFSIAVNENRGRIYLSDVLNSAVHVIDGDPASLTFNTLLDTVTVGLFPYGVDLNEVTDEVYVADYGSNTVSVLTPQWPFSGPTTVPGGTISTPTVWDLAGSPYIVTGNVIVSSTLTIEPGVVVQFTSGTGLQVTGSLTAQGNSTYKIYFTDDDDNSPLTGLSADDNGTPGGWNGIDVGNNGLATLGHTEIRYGGTAGSVALRKRLAGTLIVDNTLIRDSGAHGIRIHDVTSAQTLSNVTVQDSAAIGVWLETTLDHVTFTNLTVTDSFPEEANYAVWLEADEAPTFNGTTTLGSNFPHQMVFSAAYSDQAVAYDGAAGLTDVPVHVRGGTISTAMNWSSVRPYLVFAGNLTVTGTLTIDGPTSASTSALLQFVSGASLQVVAGGTLNAVGTVDHKIYFTDVNDSSPPPLNGTDAGTPGGWDGISIATGGSATMDYCEVRYGGAGATGAIRMRHDGTLSLDHSIVRNGGSYGVYMSDLTAAQTVRNSEIYGNANAGVYLSTDVGSFVTLEDSEIHSHANQGVHVSGPSSAPNIMRNLIYSNDTGILCNNSAVPVIGDAPGDGNDIYGNATYGVHNTSAGAVSARHNWWGSPTGPTHVSNTGGTGDEVSDGVAFIPYVGYSSSAVTWDGGGVGNSWEIPENWSGDALPGPGDDVVIDLNGADVSLTGTVSVNSLLVSPTAGSTTSLTLSSNASLSLASASTVGADGTLVLSQGTIGGSGDLTVDGSLSLDAAFFSGSGAVTLNGTTSVATNGATFSGRTISNGGTFNWTGGNIYLNGGSSFTNNSTFNIVVTGLFSGVRYSSGHPVPIFTNNGTLTRGTGSTEVNIQAVLNNNGTVQVDTGTPTTAALSLSGGGTSASGSICRLTSIGHLRLAAGTVDFDAGSQIIDDGLGNTRMTFYGSTTTVNGSYNISGTTRIEGNTTTFNAPVTSIGSLLEVPAGTVTFNDTVSIPSPLYIGNPGRVNLGTNILAIDVLDLSWSGTVNSSAAVTVNTTLNSAGGHIIGSGTVTLPNTCTTTIAGDLTFSGRNVTNEGIVNWTSGNVHLNGGSSFTNNNAFNIDVTGLFSGVRYSSAPVPTFTNNGTLTRRTGSTAVDIQPVLNNNGTVQVDTGTTVTAALALSGGGTSTSGSIYRLTGDGHLRLAAGTAVFDAGSQIIDDGLGSTKITFYSGTSTVNGTYDVSGTTQVSGGTTTFNAPVTSIGALLDVPAGTVTFNDTVAIPSPLNIGNPGRINLGTNVLDVDVLDLSWSGTLNSSAAVTVNTTFNSAGGQIIGSGTVTLPSPCTTTIAGGLTFSGRTVTNEGTVNWNSSNIHINNGTTFTNSSVLNINGTELFSGVYTSGAASTFINDGTVTMGSGRDISFNPPLINNGTLDVVGKTLTFNGDFTNGSTGTVMGGGTIFLSGFATNTNDGTFAPGASPGILSVTGDWNQSADGTLELEIGGPGAGNTDTDHDQLSVSGQASIAGTLNANLWQSYNPVLGTKFTILSAASLDGGTFGAVTGDPGGGRTWKINYDDPPNSGDITIEVANSTSDVVCSGITIDAAFLTANNITSSTDLTLSGTGTCTIATTLEVNSLQVNSGVTVDGNNQTISTASDFDNQGTLTMNGGTIDGPGTLTNNGTLISSGTDAIDSTTFVNDGTVQVGLNGHATLTVANGFTNSGLVNLTNGTGGHYSRLIVTTGALANSATGTISAPAVFASGFREIQAEVNSSAGTIDVEAGQTLRLLSGPTHFGTGTTLNGAGTIDFVNNGHVLQLDSQFTYPSVATVLASSGILYIEGPGAFINDGTFTLTGDTINADLTNNGTLISSDADAINSTTFVNDGTLQVGLNGHATLTVANGFTNSGLINLTNGAGGHFSKLIVTTGVLMNNATGTIQAPLVVASGARDIQAEVNSSAGTIDVEAGQTLRFLMSPTYFGTGTTLNGAGTIDFVNNGHVLQLDSQFTYPSVATVLASSGILYIEGPGAFINDGTFTLTGDTINADLTNNGTLISSDADAINSTTFVNDGTLQVGLNGHATLTVANGFTNSGLIDLTNGTGGHYSTLNISTGVLTNNVTGTIQVSPAPVGGQRDITGNILNEGQFTADHSVAVGAAGSSFTNNPGTIAIAQGKILTVNSGTFTNGSGGTIQGMGTLEVNSATYANNGTINPGTSPGILTVSGSLPQGPGSVINIDIGGASPGNTDGNHDQLLATGQATLAGTLNATFWNSYDPPLNSTFVVLDAASLAAGTTFSSVTGPGAGMRWEVTYDEPSGTVTLRLVPLTQTVDCSTNPTIDGAFITSNGINTGTDLTFSGSGMCTLSTALDVASVTVETGVTVAHANEYSGGVDITTSGDFVIQSGGIINVDGRGYAGGTGPETGSGGNVGGGAGHGGDGGDSPGWATGGTTYGSVTMPVTLGSGGGFGQFSCSEGHGGGRVMLTIGGTLTVDGVITADGLQSPTCNNPGGGSGGSVLLTVGTLAGSGSISADGGAGRTSGAGGGGGGGGRIAIYASLDGSTLLSGGNVTALSGAGAPFSGLRGGAGTVFTKIGAAPNGNLLVDNGDQSGADTTQLDELALTLDGLTIRGGANYVVPGTSSITLAAGGTQAGGGAVRPRLTIESGGAFNPPTALFTVTDLDIVNGGLVGVVTDLALSNAVFTHNGDFPATVTNLSFANGSTFVHNGTGLSITDLSYGEGSTFVLETAAPFLLNSLTVQNTGTFESRRLGSIPITNVDILTGGTMTHTANGTTKAYQLDVAATNFTLQAGGAVNVNGKGFQGGSGPGTGSGGNVGGGAGYGGVGGGTPGWATGGPTYGTLALPTDLGSGGGFGQFTCNEGPGGGAVRLTVTGLLSVEGGISADGLQSPVCNNPGGGSGGSVLIDTADMAGSGPISADGGAGRTTGAGGGGGGGGRIAFYSSGARTYSGNVTVNGGAGAPSSGEDGASGTIYAQPAADLAIAMTDAPDPIITGGALVYSMTVTNGGPDPATGVTVTDILPAGVTYVSAVPSQGSCGESLGTVTCSLGSVSAAAQATIVLTVTATAGGQVTNTANVAGNEWDLNQADNTSTADTTTVAPSTIEFTLAASNGAESVAMADLEITLSPSTFEDATVSYAVTGGTATGGGTDYTLLSGTATVIAGATTTTIPVDVHEDLIDEVDETIVVTISSPSANAVLGINVSHNYTILDNDAAGITVNPISGLLTTEAGGVDTFTVVLNTEPTADVTIGISSDNIAEGSALPASLTFTSGNWSSAQTVTVTGEDDFVVDGDIGYTVVVAPASSADGNYNGLDGDDVSATNTDDDIAGITIVPTSGLVTTEAGSSAIFDVVLDTEPEDDVTIDLSSNNPGEGAVSPVSLTFTSANWDQAQEVTVTGVDDDVDDGDVLYTIVTTGDTLTADGNYNGIDPDDVSVTNTDNDTAAVVIAQSGGSTDVAEGDTIDSYTVVLGTIPSANVVVTVSPDAQVDIGGTPTLDLIFTPANWDQPQLVTVTAVDDAVVEGLHTGSVTHTADSSDTNYEGIAVADVTANITDNDAAAVLITESGGSTNVVEGGATDTYDVVLTSMPAGAVSITVAPDAQVGADAAILIFTAGDWNIAQTVTINAVDDAAIEGAHTGTITHSAVSLGDANYDGIAVAGVTANITDNDSAAVVVTESGGSTNIVEGGATDTYDVVLTSEPADDVTVSITPDSQVDADSANLTFTAGNWNIAQTVTVNAVDDVAVEGAHTGTITHSAASPGDANYDGISVASVTANITDNDAAAVVVTESGGSTDVTEGGATDTYEVVLTSMPADNVTITIAPDGQVGTDATALTFTPGDWNIAQTVTVNAVDDAAVEGAHTGTITHTSTSVGDANYDGIAVAGVTANITDNDSAAVVVTESGGSTNIVEGGATDTYEVVLTSMPADNVTITIAPDDQVGTDATTLTFTAGDWNIAQTVTVNAVDDAAVEGAHMGTIVNTATSVGDANYDDIPVPNVTANITDNDAAAVVVTESGGSTNVVEGGATDTYDVVLTSMPAGDVTITITPDGQVGADAFTLIFTAGDWNIAQTVTVNAVDDVAVEGAHTGTITHSAASTGDANYDGISVASVTANITDNDSAAVVVTESGGSTDVTEGGATDTYEVVLTSMPADDVTITIAPDGQVGVDAVTLTFTAGNWSVAQTVTVNAVDDAAVEGAHTGTIAHASASIGDTNYDGSAVASVTANITDNDAAAVVVTESGGSTSVVEGGATDTYDVVLTSMPAGDVTITITPDSQMGADTATLTFTTGNWNIGQTVTVSAVDDVAVEGAHTGTITHSAVSLGDANYDGISVASVTANITDNDAAAVVVTESGGSTDVTEGGATDTYEVVLTSMPADNVTITIAPDGQVGTDATALTFTPGDWNIAQTVTVNAVDDAAVEGAHTGTITHTSTSVGDANYDGIAVAGVTANITDNDAAAVAITESGGSTNVVEGGATDTYEVVLTSMPAGAVSITVAPDAQVGADAAILIFTASDWNIAQTVTINAVDDAAIEGAHTGTITHSAVSLGDANYDGIAVAGVTANITDNDSAEVVVTESGGSTNIVEGGATDTYDVVLTSMPADDVTITITPDSQVGADAATLTFTAGDWNIGQTVTVSAVDDVAVEGVHTGTITHSAASTGDANYDGISVASVTASITDNDAAAVVVTELGGSTDVTEGGATDTYEVVLTSMPADNVTITIAPDGQVGTDATALTFTTGNWNVAQTVTVNAVDDAAVEGAHTGTITHTASSPGDGNYDGIAVASVTANITDNDVAAVVVTESGGSTNVVEGGATDTYDVVLTSMPAGDVTITITPDGQVGADAFTLIFTAGDWNIAQTVTVNAVDDVAVEGAHTGTITHTAASTGDANYDGIAVAGVTANITDNDAAAVVVTESGGSTDVTEGGATDTYDVVLTSMPADDVTITIAPDGHVDADATSLTFTTGNWNIAQIVTVNAVDDAAVEGAHTGTITHTASSPGDGNYDGIAVASVTANITDNDVAAVVVTESGGSTNVVEGGATDSYEVILTSVPVDVVTITITPDGQVGADATTLTFTAGDWNISQTVTVSAVDDAAVEGAHTGTIINTATSIGDANYDDIPVSNVTANITDNDAAAVVVTESGGSTNVVEGGATDTYDVVLTSMPVGDVTITITPDGQVGADAFTLIFTAGDWNIAQTVTVNAVDDVAVEGAHTGTITHTAASTGDANYNGIAVASVTANITDNDAAAVVVTESGGSTNVVEGGATDTYDVVLTSMPASAVKITITPGSQVGADAATLTFTAGNWNIAQTVTVNAVDDAAVEGTHTGTITHSATSAGDANYDGIAVASVTANITDNDAAAVVVTESGGSTSVVEGGATDTYDVVLTSMPADNVTITIAPDGQVDADATSLTFTTGNWNVAQTVTVNAVDDVAVEGAHTGAITHTASSTGDANYDGIAVASVTANITDNDAAAVVVTESGGSTDVTEGGATDTYEVVLTSMPADNVTITITPDGQVGTDATALTFTTGNWNIAQTVTVNAVDDAAVEGAHTGTITHTSASPGDANYDGIAVAGVTANITDNDAAAVVVTESGGSTNVVEGGATDSYEVVLGSQPTDIVDITIFHISGQVVTTPTALQFMPLDWDIPQTVTVDALDDTVAEGTHSALLSHIVVSNDLNYDAFAAPDVAVIITDNDTPGIIVTESGGATAVTEGGSGDTYTVVLATQPASDVTVSVGHGTQVLCAPDLLTFTSVNWQTAQTVTVDADDDLFAEGPHNETISHAVASSDPNYNQIDAVTITIDITDNDTAGITVNPTSGLRTTEAGGTAAFTVVLDSPPLTGTEVSIPLSSSDLTEGTVSPSQLVFSQANWNNPQAVTIAGVDDLEIDGDMPYTVVTGEAVSADASYSSMNPADAMVTNIDDDVAGQRPPVAIADQFQADEDVRVRIPNLLKNDYDPDGDPISLVKGTQPVSGSIVVENSVYYYVPKPDFSGVDSFTYTIRDPDNNQDRGNVTVTVNPVQDPPLAADDRAQTAEGQGVDIDVLDNDRDADGDPIVIRKFEQPANGSVVRNTDNTFTYLPEPGFRGTDTFRYLITDGNGGRSFATVTVSIISLPPYGFFEDFDDGVADSWHTPQESSWRTMKDAYVFIGRSAEGAVYHSQYMESYTDFTYGVDVYRASGYGNRSLGIIFRTDGTYENGYVFNVNSAGYFFIYKRVNGGYELFSNEWKPHDAIRRGENVWNRLEVTCRGSNLVFTVNGQVIDRITDSTFTRGAVGIKAYGLDGDVVGFDNAVLSLIPGAP